MLPIKFEKISFRNLFSYGNELTTLNLNDTGMNLIVGDSGAGKSTVLDAVLFALFGKPYKKVNKGSIINSVNDKACECQLTFSIGDDVFDVFRGAKPAFFEIRKNGEMLDKDAKATDLQNTLENRILGGINWNTFTQTFIIGTANYVPFMMLDASKRREFVETLLGLSVFGTASSIAKSRLSKKEAERSELIASLRVKQAIIDEKNETVRLLYEQKMRAEKASSTNIAEIEGKIDALKESISADMSTLATIKANMDSIKAEEISSFNKSETAEEVRSLVLRRKQWEDVVSLFKSDACPTCKRALDKNDTSHFDYHGAVAHLDEINKRSEQLASMSNTFNQYEKRLNEQVDEGKRIANNVKNKHAQIASLVGSIESMKKEQEKVVDSSAIDASLAAIKDAEAEIANIRQMIEVETDIARHMKLCVDMLKDDGIKANIIKVFIPIMNQMIGEYTREFELDFDFSFDEKFVETIKGRGRDDYVYENISQGEKRRLDISILFTWIEIARMKNSLDCNLMIADEIMDSSLDSHGVSTLVNIFKRWIEETGKSIFIISHRQELMDSFFDSVYKVSKDGQFSRIEKVDG